MQFAFRIPHFPVLLDTGNALLGARTPTELEKKAARLSVSEQPKLYVIDSTAEDFTLDPRTMLVIPRASLRRRTKSEIIALYNLHRDPGQPEYTTASLGSKRVERVVADLVELLLTDSTTAKSRTAASYQLLSELTDWPRRWMRSVDDLTTGGAILVVLEPFLSDLTFSSLSTRTIRRHFDHAFLLGGEIIDQVNLDPSLRALDGIQLVLRFVDAEGGPLCRHLPDEASHRLYDSICRKLFQHLTKRSSKAGEPKD